MKRFDIVGELNVFDKPVLERDLLNTISDAENIIEQAQMHAQYIIEQAQMQGEQIIEEARQTGEQIIEQNRMEIRQETDAEKSKIIAEMYGNIEIFLQGLRDTMPVFVENILYRVIGAFDEQQLLARCIAMGIEDMREAAELYVKVNAKDYDVVKPLLLPWLREGADGFIRIEKDGFVDAGECVLSSNVGTIELSLEKQINVFIMALHQQFGTTPTPEEEMEMAGEYVENDAYYGVDGEGEYAEEQYAEEGEEYDETAEEYEQEVEEYYEEAGLEEQDADEQDDHSKG